jgi:photolyase PhrII
LDDSLPSFLSERFRWMVSPDQTVHGPGEFVLYWMHNAIRAHENPALDVAICLARQNGLPLLVYHALSEDYPYASDRFHAFILQGQRDVQRELTDRGIRSYFHLQRDGDRGPHLKSLTRRAAVLVTEEMPVQPLVGWMERLVASTSTPIAMVDATCVVPVGLVDKAYTRAFEYRNATKPLYDQRIDRPYQEQVIDVDFFDAHLPFIPMNLQDACLATLIGQCRIDHSVAPVIDTPGGSRAGYARWNAFVENGLAQYEHRRNDAADHVGPSRMSAYLHFGMVSPLRIARQASQCGAEKYLDELLIWREMSFHFCHHRADEIDSMDALPKWAKESLSKHAGDPRSMNCSWETLTRARTNQPLWDACQRSLLKHGELHNNVRMTWGKAMLPWTSSPGRALQLTMDLNHRFALDGRDPNSYGGVLWCFGQFDRPFSPESNVFGRVRTRDPEQHMRRLDLEKFVAVVDRPISPAPSKVAVIGAGLGGLIAARTLADVGLDVTVFDKSRGVGGRMATRRIRDVGMSSEATEISFDHGAQYFTARDGRFCRFVQSWIHDGIVQPWLGRIVELATRHCSSVSRSRMVTVPSVSVWPSTVMQNGVPASSWRR